jgi:threonine dehydratase
VSAIWVVVAVGGGGCIGGAAGCSAANAIAMRSILPLEVGGGWFVVVKVR